MPPRLVQVVEGRFFGGMREEEIAAHVEVRIADEGRGMTAEELGRIERPYRSTRADGNGLGLKIARRVVASHGGTLSISSTHGVGTEVVVRLPVQ